MKNATTPAFDLTSGCLCLDFVNTVDYRLGSHPLEKLTRFADLVAFEEKSGGLSSLTARKLLGAATERAPEASAFFKQAIALREMLFRIFSAVAGRREVSKVDVKMLNAAFRESNAHCLITPADPDGAWQRLEQGSDCDRLIGKIVSSAVQILTSDNIHHVKMCAAENCGWLFIDHSRGHNRRWCDMRTCGSRHKARAYYQRKLKRT